MENKNPTIKKWHPKVGTMVPEINLAGQFKGLKNIMNRETLINMNQEMDLIAESTRNF